MIPFGKSEPLETYDDTIQTNDICPQSGYWTCKEHASVKIFIRQGEVLPKCQTPTRHSAVWYRIMNSNEL